MSISPKLDSHGDAANTSNNMKTICRIAVMLIVGLTGCKRTDPAKALKENTIEPRTWTISGGIQVSTLITADEGRETVQIGTQEGEFVRVDTVPISKLSKADQDYLAQYLKVKKENIAIWTATGLPICKRVVTMGGPATFGFEYSGGRVLGELAKAVGDKAATLSTWRRSSYEGGDAIRGFEREIKDARYEFSISLPGYREVKDKLFDLLVNEKPYLVDSKNKRWVIKGEMYRKRTQNRSEEYGCHFSIAADSPFDLPVTLVLPWGRIELTEISTKL